jgi:Ni,Fe-hydrogenase III large subunit
MNGISSFATTRNGLAIGVADVPGCDFVRFRRTIVDAVADGARVLALFGDTSAADGAVDLYAILSDDTTGLIYVGTTQVKHNEFHSLTPDCPQVHMFEREIAEQFGLRPEGHPWIKPVRFQKSLRPGHDIWATPIRSGSDGPIIGVTDFYRMQGDEIHEVAVGPVHAGVIEPGHFRFQCHGEHVFHLEISLGYQHRGVERALVGGPNKRTIHYMETLAGDTSAGHAIAYCQAVEALADCQVPARAEAMRGIALELERLANHTGDLGALANDVGFLPTASYCGRLRGDFLNATAVLCGSRFGRGMIRPGGVAFDVNESHVADLTNRLDCALKDVTAAANLLWDSSSVMARFEETGHVSPDVCKQLGLVGPAARACGAERDVRRQFPWGIFQFSQIPVSIADSGDVFARAYVRWLEIQRSVAFIREQLESLPSGPVREPFPQSTDPAHPTLPPSQPAEQGKNELLSPLRANRLTVSLVEGWRGEICHVAITDERGAFKRYKVVDPSFHNWAGLAIALRDGQISDFPLCNKSFNLSYCGFDL